ncbi:MAG: flagellar protein FlaG [Pelosinus sp.]|nr:flagellar protein FlaG [Pelosinus sp.]
MDIKTVGSYSVSALATAAKPVNYQTESAVGQAEGDINSTTKFTQGNEQQSTNKVDDSKQHLTKEHLQDITDGLNNFMESINTDIRFAFHSKMQELIVQVVDTKTNKVIKEVPSKEMLDTLARIRDCVGALLDKKA